MDVTFAQSIKPRAQAQLQQKRNVLLIKNTLADQDARVPKQRGGEKFALIKTNLFDHPGTESRGQPRTNFALLIGCTYALRHSLFQ